MCNFTILFELFVASCQFAANFSLELNFLLQFFC